MLASKLDLMNSKAPQFSAFPLPNQGLTRSCPSIAQLYQQRWRRIGQHPPSYSGQPRRLIVLLAIASTTLAVCTTAFISYRVVRGLILDNLQDNTLLKVQQGTQEIDEWLATRKAEVEGLASTPIFRTMDWSIVGPYLKSQAKWLREFYHFSMVNPDGSYYNTSVGRANRKLTDREQFKQAIAGNVYVSDPVISRTKGIPIVVVAVPVWSEFPPTGTPIGISTGVISIDRLVEVVGHLKYGKGSYAFALNSEGEPIIHPNPDLMGTSEKPALKFLESSDPQLQHIARHMVDRQSGIELVELDGKWVYVTYSPLHHADWSVALVIPRQNLEKQLYALNFLAWVVGMLLAAATIAAVRVVLESEQTRTLAEREALLNRITGQIRASLDLDRILEATVEELAALLHLERVVFGWYHPQEQILEIQREYCPFENSPKVGRFSVDVDLEARLQQNQAVELKNPAESESLQLKNRSYVATSIPIETPSPGYLICVRRTPRFNGRERELLQAVADQLAIAITQSHLYNQTQEQVELLADTLRELRQTQTHLIQSEKMSSLGQMVAGIAHEINNPVSFIYGNLNHVDNYTQNLLDIIKLYDQYYPETASELQAEIEECELDYIKDDLPQTLRSMRQGVERIRQIVLSLRNFSRLDESDRKSVDIHEGIDSTLLLLQNQFADKILAVKQYGNLPKVECCPGKLNQVFLNILSNAIDALEDIDRSEKIITIKTEVVEKTEGNWVRVAIADNGPGISPEIQSKIYDPFFTTKPVGKGTGLGLAISYQIVTEVHGGQIYVQTPPRGGTEFVVEIPIN